VILFQLIFADRQVFLFQPSPAKLLQYLFVLYFYPGSRLFPVRSSSTFLTVIFIIFIIISRVSLTLSYGR
jgi:hypothetical protein